MPQDTIEGDMRRYGLSKEKAYQIWRQGLVNWLVTHRMIRLAEEFDEALEKVLDRMSHP